MPKFGVRSSAFTEFRRCGLDLEELEREALTELPQRLETSSFFSPVIIVQPQIAIAVNGVNFGGNQSAAGVNLAGLGVFK